MSFPAFAYMALSVSPLFHAAAVHTDTAQGQWCDAPCFICKDVAGEDNMVECNGCGITFHLPCLSPPRQTAPSRSFFYPACAPKGLSATHALYMPHTPIQYRQNDPYLCIDLLDFLADGTLPAKATSSSKAVPQTLHSPSRQWRVVSNRFYPYKYAHHCYDADTST